MEPYLRQIGFIEKRINNSKYGYYLKGLLRNSKIIYVSQSGLKMYVKQKYGITLYRNPDEAYIIKKDESQIIIKILEKKEQHREGSVEIKLWAGPSLKREYEIILANCAHNFVVEYAYCVNKFLLEKFKSNNKKYNILGQILDENHIVVLCGDEPDYQESIERWILSLNNCGLF